MIRTFGWRLERMLRVIAFKFKRIFYTQDSSGLPQQASPKRHSDSLHYLHKALRKDGLQSSELTLDTLQEWAQKKQDAVLQKVLWQYLHTENVSKLSWDCLNLVAEMLAIVKDQQAYESLIKAFDPGLTLIKNADCAESGFIYYGLGEQTLNTYRYVALNGDKYFEKIYLSDSDDLKHLLWFFHYGQQSVIDSGLNTPRVLKVREGGKLTAVYFEYFDGQLDNLNHFLKNAISISIRLSSIELPKEARNEELCYQFKEHQIYRDNFQLLPFHLKKLGVKQPKLLQMQALVKTFPVQFCHGDLHGKNMGAPNVLIDWDRAGLYPLGFDVAYILSNRYDFVGLDDFMRFLEEHFRLSVATENWDKFVFATAFFSLVFYSRKMGKKILPLNLLKLNEFLEVGLCNEHLAIRKEANTK